MGLLMIDLTIKGSLALLLTAALAHALRGRAAATRHAVWTMGLTVALLLPVAGRLLPAWNLPVLPASTAAASRIAAGATASAGIDVERLLGLVWGIGAVTVALGIVVGRLRIRWLARGARPVDRGEIPALATELCGRIGISRPVSVRLGPGRVMPMVWGVSRPVILLPSTATGWPRALTRSVLLHELAHVRRHDYLNMLVGRLACAVHWYNPLVWIAARRLRAERERACDDQVLGAGACPCDYAAHLIAVVRVLRPLPGASTAIAMASRSAFAERVTALLDARCPRGVQTAGLLLRSGLGAACLLVPLAAVHPSERALDATPIPQLVGPPPSANARAAGALPQAEPARPARRAKVAPKPHGTRSPAPRSVTLYHAPEIRAVIHLAGDGETVRELRGTQGADCDDSPAAETAPAGGRTTPPPGPTLVWVPGTGSTP